VVLLFAAVTTPVAAHPDETAHHNPLPAHATPAMRAFAEDQQEQSTAGGLGPTLCEGGSAGGFPCSNVDLEAFMPMADIGGTRSNEKANDVWGWTDGTDEYAIIGRVFGTSFVRITGAGAPLYLGDLPTHGAFGSSWRDVKVFNDHALIVSEASQHGMQVFDLTQLRGRTTSGATFSETAHYNRVASAHNIAVNEASGYAYIIGASGKNGCSGGLHMVDLSNVRNPTFAGCFSADGYTHDTQCVTYTGPSSAYLNREICFSSNEDTLTIVDVTDKRTPVLLSRTPYPGSAYTHQGWLTADHTHFLLDDELDEQRGGHNTRTRIFDVTNLQNPVLRGAFDNPSTAAIDHNQYVRGDRVFQANYRAGLRILDISEISSASLTEVGFFDVYPDGDAAQFNGAWSTYPYFPSGKVVISGIEQGLFVVRPSPLAAGDPTWAGPGAGTGTDPGTPTTAMHVGDLDGSAQKAPKGHWNATVTIAVHDANDAALPGATVAGVWSGGGTAGCVTGTAGTCTVTLANVHNSTAAVTLTVGSVAHSVGGYDAAQNHDADGDSDGTTIVVSKP
jgi:choice-of-anchor B domain-containing protein